MTGLLSPAHAGSLLLPRIGVGCNSFGTRCEPTQATRVVHAALDAGLLMFDTADFYGDHQSEVILGRALASHPRGRDAIVATKFGGREQVPPSRVALSLERSLRRLGREHVDIYQVHAAQENAVWLDDTIAELASLKERGAIREFGLCNLDAVTAAETWRRAARAGVAPYTTLQNRLNLLDRSQIDTTWPVCLDLDVCFVAYSPLANGFLTGKYRRGDPPPPGSRLAREEKRRAALLVPSHFDLLEEVSHLADRLGRTLTQLALGFVIAHAGIVAIPGATSPDHVAEASVTVANPLGDEELVELRQILHRHHTF